jgi:hypothetical protein
MIHLAKRDDEPDVDPNELSASRAIEPTRSSVAATQQFTHLTAQWLYALIVEAEYADFLAPTKVQPWPATFCTGVVLGSRGARLSTEPWATDRPT